MNKKIIIYALLGITIVLTICASLFVINNKGEQIINTAKNTTHEQKSKTQKYSVKQEEVIDEYNLYTSIADLPLVTLFDISKISQHEQKKADKILLKYQGFYIAKFNKETNKFLIITPVQICDRNVFDRHNLEILEVSLNNNDVHILTTGFSGLDGETANAVEGFVTDNETWEFDRTTEVSIPLKHTVINADGNIEYEETWNYDIKEPIKYEMKDGEGNTLSILKETSVSDTAYDIEHIFYDREGQTEVLVSIHYEGANITRLTYYNVNDKENSFSIIDEYADGLKTSEKIYNTDYALVDTINAQYKDGQIVSLEQNNNQGKEIIKK